MLDLCSNWALNNGMEFNIKKSAILMDPVNFPDNTFEKKTLSVQYLYLFGINMNNIKKKDLL